MRVPVIGYDHYREARSIADQIEVGGFPDQAAHVRAAIEDGRSGTEIFMQLRFYLSHIQEAVEVDNQTQIRIRILIEKIGEALTR
jgi:hypothetical protein